MYQHQHAFTPILHHSVSILPAPVGTQDSNFNMPVPRGTAKPSFAPVTASHRAAQKPCRSRKQGRWGALHVCIAWKIYYYEQLKKMQQKANSLHQSKYPAASLPDSVQHKEADQPSITHPNISSPCGHSAYGSTGDRSETGKTTENIIHFNRSYPSDLHASSPVSCHNQTTKMEKLEQPSHLHWKEKRDEKEKHAGQQLDTTKDLTRRDKPWDSPALDVAPLDRKRQLECDSSVKAKRMKQFDPSPISTHPSSHAMPVQHINTSDLSVLYPHSSSFNVSSTPGGFVSYPGTEMHPYQTASWEPLWDVHKRMALQSRQNVHKNYPLNTCKAIRIPVSAQRQKEAFHRYFMPPLYSPLPVRQQETVYIRGKEFLHSRYENCHLQNPGYLAASYMGP